ncbi:MAG: hypothetical protein L6R39_000675 [Caloplaca ligustica]|nr:MAG: hypothetical protein L6R39_000675 [Caloplaca ligustica]
MTLTDEELAQYQRLSDDYVPEAEDFMAETMRLHDHIVRTTPNRDDGAALLTSFNDPNVCNGIIMHFRLITGAWMKSNPDNYVPYTEGVSIDRYCATHIEPYAVEIENIGLQAYFDAILKPAGIALQVLYLDQSPGEQVTELNWPAGITHGTSAFGDVPTIRLLYRPGHYDVIYKPEDLPINLAAAVEDPRIWLMSHPRFLPSRNLCYAPQQGLDLNNFHLPGFTSAGICTMPFTTDPCPAPAACAPPSLSLSSPMSESYSISHSATPHDAIPANSPPFLQELSSEGRFRPSWYQLQMQQKPAAIQTEPCQTEAMKQ